jgi:hypothetical protein
MSDNRWNVRVGASGILCLIAIIIFVLAGFDANVSDDLDKLELACFGLAFFAAAHLLP